MGFQLVYILNAQNRACAHDEPALEAVCHFLDGGEWIRRIQRNFRNGDACIHQGLAHGSDFCVVDTAQDGDDATAAKLASSNFIE